MSNLDGIKKIHLMGIGGAGVSGLALLLHGLGFEVSGCDLVMSSYCKKLEPLDIPIKCGHDPAHIAEFGPDLVVWTSAVPKNNAELQAAMANPKIKTMPRGDVLSWIFNEKFGIGVAGAHGKTTTSSMISMVLDRAGRAPSIAIGGEVIDVGSNAQLGESDIMVAELDESDGSFEKFYPAITVITNVDWDHVDHYKTVQDVEEAFLRFAMSRKKNSKIIICADDAGGAKLIESLKKAGDENIITYGYGKNWDWSASEIEFHEGGGVSYSLSQNGKFLSRVKLKVSGEHNVLNSLSACAAVSLLGVEPEKIFAALGSFSGAKRRFQLVDNVGNVRIYDDYAHHPVEIKATIEAARRAFPNEKITVVFQPHRYTRTQLLYKEFARVLALADKVFLLPVYSADEPEIEGVSSQLIANEINNDIIHKISVPFYVCNGVDELFALLDERVREGLIFTLGAGDITELGYAYAKKKNFHG